MQGRNPILASVEFLLMQCKVHYRSVITNTKQLHIMQYYALRSRDFFPLHTDYIVGRFHCIVNADFLWLQVNAFQCTGLPLLVMYQMLACPSFDSGYLSEETTQHFCNFNGGQI